MVFFTEVTVMSASLSRQDWEQRAAALQIQGQAFVAGQYQGAASGETFECVSPIDGRVLVRRQPSARG